MTTQEIATRLVELCKKGQFDIAQKELFAQDAVSNEPYSTPDFEKETKGLDAITEKGKKWMAMVEQMNSITVSDLLIVGNSFACIVKMDVIMKEGGQMNMTELCVYEVKDGKIVSETFYV